MDGYLRTAVQSNNPIEVRRWLSQGADPDARDFNGEAVLTIAVKRGCDEIVRMLLDRDGIYSNGYRRGATVDQRDWEWKTALHWAAQYDHDWIIMTLIMRGADMEKKTAQGETPLMLACKHSNLRTIKKLIMLGARIEQRDLEKCTALFYSARAGCAGQYVCCLIRELPYRVGMAKDVLCYIMLLLTGHDFPSRRFCWIMSPCVSHGIFGGLERDKVRLRVWLMGIMICVCVCVCVPTTIEDHYTCIWQFMLPCYSLQDKFESLSDV